MQIRPRAADDLDGAVRLARATHDSDAYPRFLPTDLSAFLVPPDEIAAWVAVVPTADSDKDAVVGHVALHRATSEPAIANLLTAVTDEPSDGFALLARLLVSPEQRGAGLGRRLIEAATAGAAERNLRLALDVDQGASGPIAVYEKLGWTRIGDVEITVHDDHRLALWVYLPPE